MVSALLQLNKNLKLCPIFVDHYKNILYLPSKINIIHLIRKPLFYVLKSVQYGILKSPLPHEWAFLLILHVPRFCVAQVNRKGGKLRQKTL